MRNFFELFPSIRSMEEEGFELGGEFLGFGLPVADDGGGGEDEGRKFFGAAP